jgi:hypothetical protein
VFFQAVIRTLNPQLVRTIAADRLHGKLGNRPVGKMAAMRRFTLAVGDSFG